MGRLREAARDRTGPTPRQKGSVRTFKGALVLVDYPNQPFVITQPKGSTPFGNPSAEANGVPRDQVAEFYRTSSTRRAR